MEYNTHNVEWDTEKIKRFWDHFSVGESEDYFSKVLGGEVLSIALSHVKKIDPILDYGCGPGYLLDHCIKLGIPCAGADFSPESIQLVKNKFSSSDLFKGGYVIDGIPISEIKENSFGSVFFLETIEHLRIEERDKVIAEICRILRPGGHVIITTQNEENLSKHKTVCPDCGAVFHRMQHMDSFNDKKMNEIMKKNKFTSVYNRPVNFRKSGVESNLKGLYEHIKDVFGFATNKKNLIYIGKK